MIGKSQDQHVSEGSVALQVGGSAESVSIHQTQNYGLTVEQVRTVAQDAFRADFYKFLDHAGDIATARAQRVVEGYLEKIQKVNPAALEQANDPSFRYALLTAQRANALHGDENLEGLLVEMLVERSRASRRSIQQMILNEALELISKLTDEQITALTVSFVVRRTVLNRVINFETFLQFMDERIQPFVKGSKLSDAAYSHLMLLGCGSEEIGDITLADAFLKTYPSVWQAGFHQDDPDLAELPLSARILISPSEHSPGLLQVLDGPANSAEKFREHFIPDENMRRKLDPLLARPRLSLEQIKDRCCESRPYMEELFDLWDNTQMKKFKPSSVGVAIAHANMIRMVPDFGQLSIWIN